MVRGRLLVDNSPRKFERLKGLHQKNAVTDQELNKPRPTLPWKKQHCNRPCSISAPTLAAVRYQQSVLESAQRQLAETTIFRRPVTALRSQN